MAGPTQLDTRQLLTYLYLYTLTYIIHFHPKCPSKQPYGDQKHHLGILPGTPLASLGALGAHEPPQVQTEGLPLLERESKMESNLMGSPLCQLPTSGLVVALNCIYTTSLMLPSI
jgi:hypothetical protein